LKTEGLTRGEILIGMEKGDFKLGDKFVSNTGGKAKIIDDFGLVLVHDNKWEDNVSMSVTNSTWEQVR
jgi:hypothetical protein